MNDDQLQGRFVGVGVGPGDPELLTLKAARLIKSAHVISYLVNDKGESQARHIVRELMGGAGSKEELPVFMPMSEDRTLANRAYDLAEKNILGQVEQGKTVIFLCEGDPLFFASFAYLLERIQTKVRCEVVPGISSVHAASATLCAPLAMLGESFAVVSGRHSQVKIEACLLEYDSVVILKAGRARQRILKALAATGRSQEASCLEYIGRDNQSVVKNVGELTEDVGPYFSLFVVVKSPRDTR